MSNIPPATTRCQGCEAEVNVVFVVDANGVVSTPVIHRDQAVSAVLGTAVYPYPNLDGKVEGEYKWLCEKCVRRDYESRRANSRKRST